MSERSLISKESLATLGEPRSRDWRQTIDDLALLYTSGEWVDVWAQKNSVILYKDAIGLGAGIWKHLRSIESKDGNQYVRKVSY